MENRTKKFKAKFPRNGHLYANNSDTISTEVHIYTHFQGVSALNLQRCGQGTIYEAIKYDKFI